MFPATATRVSQHTTESVNEEIRQQSEQNVARCASAGPQAIDHRLRELDEEWDIERMLQTNFAILSLAGVALGELVDRRWHWFTAGVAAFMVQHSLQGWCPPVPIFRRLGIRTQTEIDQERYALKALRGDFQNVPRNYGESGQSTDRLLEAAQR